MRLKEWFAFSFRKSVSSHKYLWAAVRTHSRMEVFERRELGVQQKIPSELSRCSDLFIDLDEHLFDGERCAINHFTKLLKDNLFKY
jgi:hypothetical protein